MTSGIAMAKAKEGIALGVTTSLVGKDVAILNLAVVGKCDAKAIRGGFPAEIMDEELPLGRVKVSKAGNLSEGNQVKVGGSNGWRREIRYSFINSSRSFPMSSS